ncbi:MAG: type II toxin-antitoxin system RelE/ParE family toxin [Candidatus Sungbacteria bacterium]|uniref:Type II toxin-antitoxin system RelE/ParE family toxin n=1 Tax=Candidatus Sungiibacteriota bacterium TaxID=2750080 RepID=A0A931SCB1_9BACT|nr:type II toxin-antitoxin system RelE/ParE family toxin [Candidatus Sungbacteria bacterium]
MKKATARPEVYGKPLRRSLKGYQKLRVRDYRVIYRIERSTVKVFVIQHRSVVYQSVEKRIR